MLAVFGSEFIRTGLISAHLSITVRTQGFVDQKRSCPRQRAYGLSWWIRSIAPAAGSEKEEERKRLDD